MGLFRVRRRRSKGLVSTINKINRTIEKNRSIEKKGQIGENLVHYQLNPLIFGKVNHRQINNLILKDEKGRTHQIDHIEIRENGIFCIETKNYSGLILGSESQEMWTQVLGGGTVKNQFLNPYKQNEVHVYHIKKALENTISSLDSLCSGNMLDLVSIDIKNIWLNLGDITGNSNNEDIIDDIFSKFCVGK